MQTVLNEQWTNFCSRLSGKSLEVTSKAIAYHEIIICINDFCMKKNFEFSFFLSYLWNKRLLILFYHKMY